MPIALSRRKQGFESCRERQRFQLFSCFELNQCPVCVPAANNTPAATVSAKGEGERGEVD
jgi:hypothetical protein